MHNLKMMDKDGNILKEVKVPSGTRLVNAISEQGVDILHICGGNAKCTTCRVEFVEGEPSRYTKAEQEKISSVIEKKGDLDKEMQMNKVRLSCQCLVENDMSLKILKRLVNSPDRDNPGRVPETDIFPEAEWAKGAIKR